MNTPHSRIRPTLTLALAAAALLLGATALRAQNTFIAYDLLTPTNGNQGKPGLSVGNDFYVVNPITVWKLGVFDHLGDGIMGNAALTVQLYSRRGNSGASWTASPSMPQARASFSAGTVSRLCRCP